MGLVVCTCRHHSKSCTQKRLYNHPPRKLCPLSSIHADDICAAQLRPTSFRTVKKGKFNTIPASFIQNSNYAGIDSAHIEINPDRSIRFKVRIMAMHRAEAMHRSDIQSLSQRLVEDQILDQRMFDSIVANRDRLFDSRCVDLLSRAASGTPVYNSAVLQHAATTGDKIFVCCYDNKKEEEFTTMISRNWDPIIYNSQVNDPLGGYGCRMKMANPVLLRDEKNLTAKQNADNMKPSMMAHILLGFVGSCAELYHAIDSKDEHSYNNYSGYLLSFIHHDVMKHSDPLSHRMSPFNHSNNSHSEIWCL